MKLGLMTWMVIYLNNPLICGENQELENRFCGDIKYPRYLKYLSLSEILFAWFKDFSWRTPTFHFFSIIERNIYCLLSREYFNNY